MVGKTHINENLLLRGGFVDVPFRLRHVFWNQILGAHTFETLLSLCSGHLIFTTAFLLEVLYFFLGGGRGGAGISFIRILTFSYLYPYVLGELVNSMSLNL